MSPKVAMLLQSFTKDQCKNFIAEPAENPHRGRRENSTGIVGFLAFSADFLGGLCDSGLVLVFNEPLLRQFSA
jgi:hypothetical protein